MAKRIAEIESTLEFVADIEGKKDCLMAQQGEDVNQLWFNIDVPKGHGLKAGSKVRVIVETVDTE
ncbi:MAG TPA: hypothetical protein O0X97_00720 [Methanocorpusculum sp.]|nr:hypothetical protein [Methanocorpusculum sp.]